MVRAKAACAVSGRNIFRGIWDSRPCQRPWGRLNGLIVSRARGDGDGSGVPSAILPERHMNAASTSGWHAHLSLFGDVPGLGHTYVLGARGQISDRQRRANPSESVDGHCAPDGSVVTTSAFTRPVDVSLVTGDRLDRRIVVRIGRPCPLHRRRPRVVRSNQRVPRERRLLTARPQAQSRQPEREGATVAACGGWVTAARPASPLRIRTATATARRTPNTISTRSRENTPFGTSDGWDV
jgi:hypothetical protein